MSGSITFERGPVQGWRVQVDASWADGKVAHVTVQIESPGERAGLFGFRPGIDGFEQAEMAELASTPRAMAELLDWLMTETARALRSRSDIDGTARQHWQAVLDDYDHSRAEFYARYPDGKVPPFEVVAAMVYDSATATFAEVRAAAVAA